VTTQGRQDRPPRDGAWMEFFVVSDAHHPAGQPRQKQPSKGTILWTLFVASRAATSIVSTRTAFSEGQPDRCWARCASVAAIAFGGIVNPRSRSHSPQPQEAFSGFSASRHHRLGNREPQSQETSSRHNRAACIARHH
jgi:hypothetical protein